MQTFQGTPAFAAPVWYTSDRGGACVSDATYANGVASLAFPQGTPGISGSVEATCFYLFDGRLVGSIIADYDLTWPSPTAICSPSIKIIPCGGDTASYQVSLTVDASTTTVSVNGNYWPTVTASMTGRPTRVRVRRVTGGIVGEIFDGSAWHTTPTISTEPRPYYSATPLQKVYTSVRIDANANSAAAGVMRFAVHYTPISPITSVTLTPVVKAYYGGEVYEAVGTAADGSTRLLDVEDGAFSTDLGLFAGVFGMFHPPGPATAAQTAHIAFKLFANTTTGQPALSVTTTRVIPAAPSATTAIAAITGASLHAIRAGTAFLQASANGVTSTIPVSVRASGDAYEPFAPRAWTEAPNGRFFRLPDGTLTDLFPGYLPGPDAVVTARQYLRTERRSKAPPAGAPAIRVTTAAVGGPGSFEDAYAQAYAADGGYVVIPKSLGHTLSRRTAPARPGAWHTGDGITPRAYGMVWQCYENVVQAPTVTPAPASTDGLLPAEGTRIDPANGAQLPGFSLVDGDTTAAFEFGLGCYGVRVVGLGFFPSPTRNKGTPIYKLANIPTGTVDCGFDQCYFEGAADAGYEVRVCANDGGSRSYGLDLWFAPNNASGADANSWHITEGHPGPLKIVNPYISGLAEPIIAPGDGPGNTQDVELRMFHTHHPMRFCKWHSTHASVLGKPLDVATGHVVSGYANDGTTQTFTVSPAFAGTTNGDPYTLPDGTPCVLLMRRKADGAFVELTGVDNTGHYTASVISGGYKRAGWAPGNINYIAANGDAVDLLWVPHVRQKNLLEMKQGEFFTIQEFVAENQWISDDGQFHAVVMKDSYYVRTKDIVIRDFVVVNVFGGLGHAGTRDVLVAHANDLTRHTTYDNGLVLFGEFDILGGGRSQQHRGACITPESRQAYHDRLAFAHIPAAAFPGAVICDYADGVSDHSDGIVRNSILLEGASGMTTARGQFGGRNPSDDLAFIGIVAQNLGVIEHGAYTWPAGVGDITSDTLAQTYVNPTGNPDTGDYSIKSTSAHYGKGRGVRDWPRLQKMYRAVRAPEATIPREY